MIISLNTYGTIGTVLFWGGIAVALASLTLLLTVARGITLGGEDDLNQHDVYYIIGDWTHPLILALPILAGLLITISGLLMRSQVSIAEDLIKTSNSVEQEINY